MQNEQWAEFFRICRSILGKGDFTPIISESWCSWTTFSRLNEDACYWASGIPSEDEMSESGIKDGGTWGQPFLFHDIAHIIIPKKFYWESLTDQGFLSGFKQQDIQLLSKTLSEDNLPHRITELVLEVKLY